MNDSFNDLGISAPILKAIEEMGFETPTEVQQRAIPHVLNQEDLIVRSKTGSGKTAVFGVSMLQLFDPEAAGPQGLVLTPTRELAVQIDDDLKNLSKYLQHRTTAVYGQHSMSIELQELKKKVSIVTGTPGRVFDHIQHRNLKTNNIRFLVLDEADRMLDMGFYDQVVRIIETLPKNRVTLLFSATIPAEIHKICARYMKNPVPIEIESQTMTVDTTQQVYYRMERNEKRTQLNRMLLIERPKSCIIFCNTRIAVDQVQRFLTGKGYASRALHGDIPQGRRLKTMEQFKHGEFGLLVATDVAARGIHIDDLSLVINYDVPIEKDGYVHRIGRTGRAGNEGRAITFVTSDDIMSLYEIEEHIGVIIEEGELPSEAIFNEQRAEAEKWIQENTIKHGMNEPSTEDDRKESSRRSTGTRPPQRHNEHGNRPTRANMDHETSNRQRNIHSTGPAKPIQGKQIHVNPVQAKAAQSKPIHAEHVRANPVHTNPVEAKAVQVNHIQAKPVQSTAKPVPPRTTKTYINAIQPKSNTKAVQKVDPETKKPFIKRVLQRILGK